GERGRNAGVSSFGMSGTNVHIVLSGAAAPPEAELPRTPRHELVVLSAKSAQALDAAKDALASHLETHPEQPLADVAYSLAIGRQAFAHRWGCVVKSREETVVQLRGGGEGLAPSAAEDAPITAQKELLDAWQSGAEVDWSGYQRDATRRIVPLPTYP